jgi:hypothetical protein
MWSSSCPLNGRKKMDDDILNAAKGKDSIENISMITF